MTRPVTRVLLGLTLAACASASVTATAQDAGAFSVSTQATTVKQFLAGKMRVHVRCAAECDVEALVSVSSDSARRMGMLTFRHPPPIGSASATNHAAGDFDLNVVPTQATDVQGATGFKLFKALPVRIVAKSDAAQATATTSLTWPKLRAELGGRGDGPFIKAIKGPRRVSLEARSVTFRVRIARVPGARLFTALVVTPGLHYTTGAPDALPDAVADRGGTFAIKVPIRSAHGRAAAGRLAPLAAELSLGLVTKRTGENAIFRFTLVR